MNLAEKLSLLNSDERKLVQGFAFLGYPITEYEVERCFQVFLRTAIPTLLARLQETEWVTVEEARVSLNADPDEVLALFPKPTLKERLWQRINLWSLNLRNVYRHNIHYFHVKPNIEIKTDSELEFYLIAFRLHYLMGQYSEAFSVFLHTSHAQLGKGKDETVVGLCLLLLDKSFRINIEVTLKVYLGAAYSNLGKYIESIDILNDVISIVLPEISEAIMDSFTRNDLSDARLISMALESLGKSYFNLDQNFNASRVLATATSLIDSTKSAIDTVNLKTWLCRSLIMQHQYDEAEEKLNEIIELLNNYSDPTIDKKSNNTVYPDFEMAQAETLLGLVMAKRGNVAKARDYFDHAILLTKQFDIPQAHLARQNITSDIINGGFASYIIPIQEQVLKNLEQLTDHHSLIMAQYTLALSYWLVDECETANQLIQGLQDQFLDILASERLAQIKILDANCYIQQDKLQEAKEIYHEILNDISLVTIRKIYAHFNLALSEVDHPEEMLKLLHDLLELDTINDLPRIKARAQYELALIAMSRRDLPQLTQLVKQFEQGVYKDPYNIGLSLIQGMAFLHLGQLNLAQNYFTESVNWSENLLKRYAENHNAMLNEGVALCGLFLITKDNVHLQKATALFKQLRTLTKYNYHYKYAKHVLDALLSADSDHLIPESVITLVTKPPHDSAKDLE